MLDKHKQFFFNNYTRKYFNQKSVKIIDVDVMYAMVNIVLCAALYIAVCICA